MKRNIQFAYNVACYYNEHLVRLPSVNKKNVRENVNAASVNLSSSRVEC